MADGKTWSMNDTQKQFVEILKENADGITLFELSISGKKFASGSINTLITKGIVKTDGEKQFSCDVVYNGVVVGKTTKTGKIYKLVG